eukprot:3452799-Rhodomonas_salina.2
MVLRLYYVTPGTDIPDIVCGHPSGMKCPVLRRVVMGIGLRTHYAISGTDTAYNGEGRRTKMALAAIGLRALLY